MFFLIADRFFTQKQWIITLLIYNRQWNATLLQQIATKRVISCFEALRMLRFVAGCGVLTENKGVSLGLSYLFVSKGYTGCGRPRPSKIFCSNSARQTGKPKLKLDPFERTGGGRQPAWSRRCCKHRSLSDVNYFWSVPKKQQRTQTDTYIPIHTQTDTYTQLPESDRDTKGKIKHF